MIQQILLQVYHTEFNIRNWSVRPPILVAARSKAWFYGRSPTGIVGSNPAGT